MVLMWSVESALLVLGLWGMRSLVHQRGIAMSTGRWTVYVLWLLWTLLGIAVVWTLAAERRPRAVGVGALFFGGVSAAAAILMAVLWLAPSG
jgi:hypothetical protein